MAKQIPPKLYKYQSLANLYTLENLRHRQLWFSKPENLNDPFDCAVPFRLLKENEKGWDKGFESLRIRIQNDLGIEKVKKADEIYVTNGKLNRKFKEDIIRINTNNIERNQEKLKDHGVACFSEEHDNILMWSHYADGHRGLCLEFDTNYFPFDDISKIHKVVYQSAYPVLSPVTFLTEKFFPITPALTKSIKWKYEKEWRILYLPGNTALEYDPKALTAIYFGCSMQDDMMRKISTMPAKSAPRLYQMQRSRTEFKLEYVPYHM